MKKYILIAILVTLNSCISWKYLDAPEPFYKNIQLDASKNENYIKANEWMVVTFKDAECVIQFSDKESGIVKGKYLIRKGITTTYLTTTTISSGYMAMITIRVKEGAARIEVESISKSFMVRQMSENRYHGFTPDQFTALAQSISDKFEEYMKDDSLNNW